MKIVQTIETQKITVILRVVYNDLFFKVLQVDEKRSDVEKIMFDIIFSTSYVVFATSNIFSGEFGEGFCFVPTKQLITFAANKKFENAGS